MLLVFIKQCDEIEFPNAVESTQQLLLQHSTQKNELEQELQRIKTYDTFWNISSSYFNTFLIVNILRLVDWWLSLHFLYFNKCYSSSFRVYSLRRHLKYLLYTQCVHMQRKRDIRRRRGRKRCTYYIYCSAMFFFLRPFLFFH